MIYVVETWDWHWKSAMFLWELTERSCSSQLTILETWEEHETFTHAHKTASWQAALLKQIASSKTLTLFMTSLKLPLTIISEQFFGLKFTSRQNWKLHSSSCSHTHKSNFSFNTNERMNEFSLDAFALSHNRLSEEKTYFISRRSVQFSFIESLRWFWILINSATRKSLSKTNFYAQIKWTLARSGDHCCDLRKVIKWKLIFLRRRSWLLEYTNKKKYKDSILSVTSE